MMSGMLRRGHMTELGYVTQVATSVREKNPPQDTLTLILSLVLCCVVLCFVVLCCVAPKLPESQVDIAQIGIKTLTKGSYSSLGVVFIKTQYMLGLQGCPPFCQNIPFT